MSKRSALGAAIGPDEEPEPGVGLDEEAKAEIDAELTALVARLRRRGVPEPKIKEALTAAMISAVGSRVFRAEDK